MQKKILIVEDEVLIGMMLAKNLREFGYDVYEVATNGTYAIQLLERYEPDLVLMDVNLKGEMNGVMTAELIKNLSEIPVIFMTAYRTSEIEKEVSHLTPLTVLDKLGPVESFKLAIDNALQ